MNIKTIIPHDPSLTTDMILNASINRLMVIDTSWKIVFWNKAAEDLTGISEEQVLGKPLTGAFPQLNEDEEYINAIAHALKGYKTFLPAKAGYFNREHFENHFLPIKTAEGKIAGVLNMMHDIAHRIKAEQELERLNKALENKCAELQQALDEIGSFTYIASTNIREPLKLVYTSLEMVIKKEGRLLSDSSKAAFRKMQVSISKMNLLLEDLLSLTGLNKANESPVEVDMTIPVNSAIAKLQDKIAEKNAEIIVRNLPVITGYSQLLTQLCYHIIDNAIKFQSPANKPIVIIDTVAYNGNDPGRPAKDYTGISFIDNGIGFDPVFIDRIFLLFEKLHAKNEYPGSGKGLSICKKIMELHNGFIDVYSVPGQGSTFTCFFPKQ